MIGYYGHMNGLPDRNTNPNGPNLATGGAALIKANRAEDHRHVRAATRCGTHAVWKTKPLVWFLEGDFIQYAESAQTSPLTMAELGQLAADITCAIKGDMPNAVVAINHTTWNVDDETNSFWCEMKRADYDLVWTTGVGNNGNFIETAGTGRLLQRGDRDLPLRPHAHGQDHRRRHQLRRLGHERQLVEPDRDGAEQPHHERRHRRQHRQQPALELPDPDPEPGTLHAVAPARVHAVI